jgi:hypothetical protein
MTIKMDTNTTESTPSPSGAAMQTMVVMITTVQTPVAANIHPTSTRPATIGDQSVLVTTDTLVTVGPEPAWSLVVVISPPQMPVRTHTTPTSLVIAVQRAQSVTMNANAPEPSPTPLCSAMMFVIVMVATVQMPVSTDNHPFCTCPTLEDAHAVEVSTNAAETTPEPSIGSVILVATVEVPI